jgi:hypothetical protein
MPKSSRTRLFLALLIAALATPALVAEASAEQVVARQQDIGDLRLGQRIRVDDGTCPAGQIKEVSGAKMLQGHVVGVARCVQRVTKAR